MNRYIIPSYYSKPKGCTVRILLMEEANPRRSKSETICLPVLQAQEDW